VIIEVGSKLLAWVFVLQTSIDQGFPKGITQDFLELVLTSRGFLSYFEPMLTGISVPHISPEQIGNYEAILPPVEEQKAICEFVSQLSQFCEQAIAKETQIVTGLRQLKTSVIADVVLGKVKV
jgi:type I restriction enzyme S subunit